MDVLFESIDVRDLLSTTSLEDSSPLSAPDLQLLIDRLDAHSRQIKSKVQAYILSHHSDFSQLLSLCSSLDSQSAALSYQLDALLSLLSNHPLYDEIKGTLLEIGVKMGELGTKKAQLLILKIIVDLCKKLENVREMVRVGQVVEAAAGLKDLKTTLRVDEEEEGEKEVVVYGLLREEWACCFEEMQESLLKFMEQAVRFELESNRVRVVSCSSVGEVEGIELRTVLEAMEALGILDYGLARVADLFVKHAITPAVTLSSPLTFREESYENLDEGNEAILIFVPCSDFKTEIVDGEALFSRIMDIVNFIFKFICLRNGTWMCHLGRLTWPRISDLIISNYLSKVVPEDASKLADFQRIINVCSEFESGLKEMMFISASDKHDERLSNFADDVEVHFASRKKAEILATARKLILECDFSLPQDLKSRGPKWGDEKNTGCAVDLLFLSQRCIVSDAACQLMKLVHRTMQDICLASPRVALEFYHAARDALLLYEAVVPVKLERHLQSVSQVPILVHNDSLYLSQEILGLAFEYRAEFPRSIKEHAVFADLPPRLRLLAEAALQKHIQTIMLSLQEAMDGADGFQNTHELKQYESAKLGIDQVVFILEKVRLLWEPLLLPSTYKRSMCMILESVLSRMTREILLLDDIAANETLQLQRLIHFMLENLTSLLESLSSVKLNDLSDEPHTRTLEEQIPSLRKIRKLSDLLDMPLKSITLSWEIGDLFGCGFMPTEVVDFIKAIFTDSPLRKECLWRIQSTNF